ncbi:transmembrane protein 150A-like [Osmerus eperlanus]|uniref:transmembrane protein 150A-like n=1 Tax=Osmerus eperlanus TaxID=29151 RepID=UPI002E0E68F1
MSHSPQTSVRREREELDINLVVGRDCDLETCNMSMWMILPVSLPVFTITGIWVVYALALYNQHVCSVDNWSYNQSCEEKLSVQRGPVLCCTVDNIPLISKCGTLPPESCFFSLICSTGSFIVMMIGLLRYALVIEKHQNCLLNTASLSTGWICATGLIMVGNFQVDFAKVLHYVGAGVAFPTSVLFVCLQSALTYRLAKTQGEYNMGHLRVGMTLLAFVSLVLSGVFFVQESYALQHASAIFEWLFCMIIMLFYGTFAFEFRGMSGDTLMVLARGGGVRVLSSSDHKVEVTGGSNHHQQETLSMM